MPSVRTGRNLEDIAKLYHRQKGIAARRGRFVALLALCLPLCGCVGSAFDFAGSSGVDKSISTATISQTKSMDGRSDEATVRNAVSSADLNKLGADPLPWANTATGSAGVVSAIREERQDGVICRQFATTRHAYDGIANFSGRTCLIGEGQWQLLSFDRQS